MHIAKYIYVMNKIILIPILIALFFAVSCSDDSEKNTKNQNIEKQKPSVCDCVIDYVDENGDKIINLDKIKSFDLSFNPVYKISDISQLFLDLFPSEEELEKHGDSILNYNLYELDSLNYTEDSTISSQLIDKLVFLNIFILNVTKSNTFPDAPELGFAKAKDTTFVKQYIINHSENLVKFDVELNWGLFETNKFNETGYYALYAVKRKKIIGIRDLDHAEKQHDTNSGALNMLLTLKKVGVDKWNEYTEKHVGEFVSIRSYQKVIMAPLIQEPMKVDNFKISGNFTVKRIENLAFYINCKLKYLDMGHEEFIQSMEECK